MVVGNGEVVCEAAGGSEEFEAHAEIGLHSRFRVVDCLVIVETCSSNVEYPRTGREGRVVDLGGIA